MLTADLLDVCQTGVAGCAVTPCCILLWLCRHDGGFDVESATRWLGGLAARAFDLRLNGREFETRRPLVLPGSDLGQVTYTYVPLSPSSITWYRCKSRGGNGRLWKWCGLLSITGCRPTAGSRPWK